MRSIIRFAGFATASFSALLVAGVIASGSARADAVAPEPVAINCTDSCGCTADLTGCITAGAEATTATSTTVGDNAAAPAGCGASCGCAYNNGNPICKSK